MGRVEFDVSLVPVFAPGETRDCGASADDGKKIVAGAVVNRSATVIGLSNVFHTHGDLESVWRGAASTAQARWGPMPVIGYDSGTALDAAHRAGFGSVGELVVWVKPAIT